MIHQPPDVAAAEAVLERALVVRQQDVVPLAPQLGKSATTAELSGMVATWQSRLPALFTGKALTDELTSIKNAAEAESDPTFQALGGGADSFHFNSARLLSPNPPAVDRDLHG